MSNKSSSSGLGVLDVVAVVFIILKLIGVINWSWVWVLSPIWIQLIILLIVICVIAIKDR